MFFKSHFWYLFIFCSTLWYPFAQTASFEDLSSLNPAVPFFNFPPGYQPENIAPRRNGQLLVSMISVPVLYQIDPFANQTGKIIHRFEGHTSVFAIAETSPDLFYMAASNFTGDPNDNGLGSVSLYEVDVRKYGEGKSKSEKIKVTKVLDAPTAQTIDGLVAIDAKRGLLVGGDLQQGAFFLFDIVRRTSERIFEDPLLKGGSISIAPPSLQVGVNGLKLWGSDLYFTNTNKTILGKVPVNLRTGKINGGARSIHEYGTYLDEISFDRSGNVFLSANLQGVILQPRKGYGQPKLFTAFPGTNSNAFGRTKRDACVLYVTYGGPSSGGVARVRTHEERYCGRVY